VDALAPAAPDSARPPFPQIGRYRLLELLGTGSFGSVWQARDTDLRREVAVKLPRGGHFHSAAEEARFLREARFMAQLHHPGIVAVHDVGKDQDTVYIVSDLVRGPSLAQWVGEGRRPGFREAAAVGAQVADALDYAHRQGVVHRDLKPANILLAFSREPEASATPALASGSRLNECVPKITDFGLAKRDAGEITMTLEGQVLGTPAYMSPEQVRNPHAVDGRSDVYSLGVILYQLLTGELPFRGVTRMVLHQVLSDEPRPPRRLNDKIPRDLETITLKCLAKEPGRRYRTAGELAADLRRWLAGEPIHARPVGRVGRVWRWCRRKPAVAGLTAALVVVFLGGFAGVTWQWRRAEDSFRQAREAVDEQFTLVSEETLLNEPGLQPLRKKLLEAAQRYYVRFLQQRSHDRTLRAELAATHHRLGVIYQEIGSVHDALQAFTKARDLRAKLVEDNPGVPRFRYELAQSYLRLGHALYATGPMDAVGQAFGEALALCEKLEQDHPSDPQYQSELAQCYYSIGCLQVGRGQFDEALGHLDKARVLQEKLDQGCPPGAKASRPQSDLAKTYIAIAHRQDSRGMFRAALESHRKASDLQARLVRDNPAAFSYQDELGWSYHNIGVLLARIGHLPPALDSSGKANAIFRKLADANPDVTGFQENLARSHNHLGLLYSELGRYPEALAASQQAVDIGQKLVKDHPTVPHCRYDLAVSYNNLGGMYSENKQPDKALESCENAYDLLKKLADDNPAVIEYKETPASNCHSLGTLHLRAGTPPKALHFYQEAAALREGLLRAHPKAAGYQIELALTYHDIGSLKSATRHPKEALEFYQKACALRERLVQASPDVPRFHSDLAASYQGIGKALWQLGRYREALTAYRQQAEQVLLAKRAEVPGQRPGTSGIHRHAAEEAPSTRAPTP
jgi:tetratricopeptide (TPR) repeat protein/tRNA A-37 threonylcarbamoyl transferase component Bud32